MDALSKAVVPEGIDAYSGKHLTQEVASPFLWGLMVCKVTSQASWLVQEHLRFDDLQSNVLKGWMRAWR